MHDGVITIRNITFVLMSFILFDSKNIHNLQEDDARKI